MTQHTFVSATVHDMCVFTVSLKCACVCVYVSVCMRVHAYVRSCLTFSSS